MMATATAQWAAAQQDRMLTTMATGNDGDNENDDKDCVTLMTTIMAMAQRAMGYNNDGNDDGSG